MYAPHDFVANFSNGRPAPPTEKTIVIPLIYDAKLVSKATQFGGNRGTGVVLQSWELPAIARNVVGKALFMWLMQSERSHAKILCYELATACKQHQNNIRNNRYDDGPEAGIITLPLSVHHLFDNFGQLQSLMQHVADSVFPDMVGTRRRLYTMGLAELFWKREDAVVVLFPDNQKVEPPNMVMIDNYVDEIGLGKTLIAQASDPLLSPVLNEAFWPHSSWYRESKTAEYKTKKLLEECKFVVWRDSGPDAFVDQRTFPQHFPSLYHIGRSELLGYGRPENAPPKRMVQESMPLEPAGQPASAPLGTPALPHIDIGGMQSLSSAIGRLRELNNQIVRTEEEAARIARITELLDQLGRPNR